MNTLEQMVRKTALIASGLFLLSTTVFGQQREFNDPQIIAVVETANRIAINFGKMALNMSREKAVRTFAHRMIKDHTKLLERTIALEQELILATQTNTIARSLRQQEAETTEILSTKKKANFDLAYIDHEVSFHKQIVSIVKNTLIPQARNQKLKAFLAKISPLLEEDLKAARNIQAEFNR